MLFLTNIFGWFQAKAAAIIGVVIALVSAYVVVYQRGKNAAKTESLKKTVEIKNAQQKAAASAPRTKSELIDELRKGKF